MLSLLNHTVMLTECYYDHSEGVLIAPDVMEYPVYKLDFINNRQLMPFTIRAVWEDGEVFYHRSDGKNFNFANEHNALDLDPAHYTQIYIVNYASLAEFYSEYDTPNYEADELPF